MILTKPNNVSESPGRISLNERDGIIAYKTLSNAIEQKTGWIWQQEELAFEETVRLNEEMSKLGSQMIEMNQHIDETADESMLDKDGTLKEQMTSLEQQMSDIQTGNKKREKTFKILQKLSDELAILRAGDQAFGSFQGICGLFKECQRSLLLIRGYVRNKSIQTLPDEIIASFLKFYYIILKQQTKTVVHNMNEYEVIFGTIIPSLKESYSMIDTLEKSLREESFMLEMKRGELRRSLRNFDFRSAYNPDRAYKELEDKVDVKCKEIDRRLLVLAHKRNEVEKRYDHLHGIYRKMLGLLNMEYIPHYEFNSDTGNCSKLAIAYVKEKEEENDEYFEEESELDKEFHDCQRSMLLIQGYCHKNADHAIPKSIEELVLKFYHLVISFVSPKQKLN